MKYCTHCGNQLLDEAVICPGCGCAVEGSTYAESVSRKVDDKEECVSSLCTRLNINGIIWIAIAVLQGLISILYYSELGVISGIMLDLIAIINIIYGIYNLRLGSEIDNAVYYGREIHIVKKFEPLTSPIVTLIFNLILGGIIGIAGSLYYLIGVRQYVLDHRDTFIEIENRT